MRAATRSVALLLAAAIAPAVYGDKKVHVVLTEYAAMPLLHCARNGGAD